jgi:hypothetical protein
MDDAMAQAVDIGDDDVSFISSSFLILLICLQFILMPLLLIIQQNSKLLIGVL